MKVKLLIFCNIVLMTFAATLFSTRFAPSITANHTTRANVLQTNPCWNPAADIPLTGVTCGTAPKLQLSCYLPTDIQISGDFNNTQRQADLFSWQEFISLNWPALNGQRGMPDPNKRISAAGPRVWETWKEEYEVFLPNGAAPAAWNSPEPVPPACGGATKRLMRTQKIDDVVDSTLQAAAATGTLPATLTDQQNHLVRYEIRMNKVMFDFIVRHKLYDANVQRNARSVSFPSGAILIKAAWREVEASEERSYHTVTACVCDKDGNGQPANCQTKKMGLVGLHITQKTDNAPQWIWSTFEQINNVPGPGAGAHPAFFNPRCASCPPNQQTKPGMSNQITREVAIPSQNPDCSQPQQALDNVQLLNANVQQAMKQADSVWQSYQLINTQWPVPPVNKTTTTVFYARPVVLGNTTMESFVQPTSTCMGCHSTARTVNPVNFVSSDFSFTLNNAQPAQSNPHLISPPAHPVTAWDKVNWATITRGYQLTTQTYELLPKNVPKARLHCASCHLNAGGNMSAAWWVNLIQEYPTPPSLQDRINGCFERSLNGNPLCTPVGYKTTGNPPPCSQSADMKAFTTYMDWLTEQWNNPGTSVHGFPWIPNLPGSAVSGKAIFQQKCAVCHRLDGQGRYEEGIYYRPALWGPHSFNKSAGMFSTPSMLAAFLRWNMPLGAGGLLTDQEAWDVQAYVDSQPRPVQSPTPTPTPSTRKAKE